MDFKKGQEYIDLLDSGTSEEALLSQYGIEYEYWRKSRNEKD